jgi:tryptophan synthase alpha chain
VKRLEPIFESLRARGEAALIAYITAGDPSLERLPDILRLLQEAGVDMVEVGFPFSDPLADGPVIQAAMHRALQGGTTLPRVLKTVAAVSPTLHTPLIAFTYYNPVQRYGLARFAQEAVAAGFTACLMTDLPPDEAARVAPARPAARVAAHFLAHPDQHRRAHSAGRGAGAGVHLLRLAHGRHGRTRPTPVRFA